MKGNIAAGIVGLIFALGLGVSGMTQPEKVKGFLDFAGQWDPDLAFVMGGAVLTYFTLFRLVLKRPRPVFTEKFSVPTRKDLTQPLVIGAALFGVGWGLSGYCPGPALTSVVTGAAEPLLFVASMSIGMLLFHLYDARKSRAKTPRHQAQRDGASDDRSSAALNEQASHSA